ncbi:MAG: S1/P1 nuclease [Acidobacteria bacterium]|nr:S1/P1 nuclease [Acidobacteriota bacterium]
MILKTLVLVSLLLMPCASAMAWHDNGHMIVAQIAYLRLTPDAKARVDKLLVTPQGKTPLIHLCAGYYTPETCEKTYDPVTIAVWMDDFRGDSLTEPYAPWHYINFNPFFDGIPVRAGVGPEPENVLARINWAVNTLRKGTGRDKSDAEVLGFLFHLAGDVHQPLHTSTRYTAAHPDGDAGGNLFPIQMPPDAHIKNLHAFWDAAGGLFGYASPHRPLDAAGQARIRQLAKEVMKANPAETFSELKDLDPHTWVTESNMLARQFVYAGIKEGETPSQAYTEQAQKISSRRIALAGYRLAAVLNMVFENPKPLLKEEPENKIKRSRP